MSEKQMAEQYGTTPTTAISNVVAGNGSAEKEISHAGDLVGQTHRDIYESIASDCENMAHELNTFAAELRRRGDAVARDVEDCFTRYKSMAKAAATMRGLIAP